MSQPLQSLPAIRRPVELSGWQPHVSQGMQQNGPWIGPKIPKFGQTQSNRSCSLSNGCILAAAGRGQHLGHSWLHSTEKWLSRSHTAFKTSPVIICFFWNGGPLHHPKLFRICSGLTVKPMVLRKHTGCCNRKLLLDLVYVRCDQPKVEMICICSMLREERSTGTCLSAKPVLSALLRLFHPRSELSIFAC